MVKNIELTQGQFAIVDDEDFAMLSAYKWHAHKGKGKIYYAISNIDIGERAERKFFNGRLYNARKITTCIKMHRLIMKPPKNMVIDHINGNGLDNRKENLRVCSPAQNNLNSTKKAQASSKYKGVRKHQGKWDARISINKETIYLGRFNSVINAATAYNIGAAIYHKQFAKFNDWKTV
jgi:hypothetical protein